MDVHFVYAGQRFRWDMEKALSNFNKHGIRFEQACEVFLDYFVWFTDAMSKNEARDAAIGLTEDWSPPVRRARDTRERGHMNHICAAGD